MINLGQLPFMLFTVPFRIRPLYTRIRHLSHPLLFEVCLWPYVGAGAPSARVICGACAFVPISVFVILCACCSRGSRFVVLVRSTFVVRG